MKRKFLLVFMCITFVLLSACSSTSEEPTPPSSVSEQTPTSAIYSENKSGTAFTNTPMPTATSTPKPTATSTPKPTATSTPKPTATSTPKPTATSTPKPTATPVPQGITLSEQVVYNNNDVVITIKGFGTTNFMGPQIKVLIENKRSENITVQIGDLAINGYMINSLLSCDVSSGKKTNDTITIYESDLKLCNIDVITNIDLSFKIINSSWKTIDNSELISLHTSAYGTHTQEYDASGIPAFDQNGIKVVVRGIIEDDIWGTSLSLYIENNSDKKATVTVDDVSVNGFMVYGLLSSAVLPGKRAIDDISFSRSDLEANGITKIENVELVFRAYDKNFGALVKTAPITINFE